MHLRVYVHMHVYPVLLAQQLAWSEVTGCPAFLQRMSQTTDDMSGWLNKDTYLSDVILVSFTFKPLIT